jgi:hypothetical protein
MKHQVFLLFALVAAGCSSNSDAQKSRVRVLFRDTVASEYVLLAVHDSALVLGSGAFDSLAKPYVVPFSRIDRVSRNEVKIMPGAILGATAGVLFAVMLGGGSHSGAGGVVVSSKTIPIVVGGTVAGVVFDLMVRDTYFVSNASDLKKLKTIALYSADTEPPELRELK